MEGSDNSDLEGRSEVSSATRWGFWGGSKPSISKSDSDNLAQAPVHWTMDGKQTEPESLLHNMAT